MCGKDCACGGRRKKKIGEYSLKTIDWTKPIQAYCGKSSKNRNPRIRYVGLSVDGMRVVDFGANYSPTTRLVFYHENGASNISTDCWVENIPEPKPEKWVNVFWDKDRRKVVGGIKHTSKEDAKSVEQVVNRRAWADQQLYLGTFRVE